jgi:hypothetical protein
MSQTLNDFFIAYMAWIDDGAPEMDTHFSRTYGLCSNLYNWMCAQRSLSGSEGADLNQELLARFRQTGLRENYPFCSGDEYDEMWLNKMQHTFEPRLKWVREQIAQHQTLTALHKQRKENV